MLLRFLPAARKKRARNAAAMTIPPGYATESGSDRHSGAERKYVADTADMKNAGTTAIQKHFLSLKRYIPAVQRTTIASVWFVQLKYLQTTV